MSLPLSPSLQVEMLHSSAYQTIRLFTQLCVDYILLTLHVLRYHSYMIIHTKFYLFLFQEKKRLHFPISINGMQIIRLWVERKKNRLLSCAAFLSLRKWLARSPVPGLFQSVSISVAEIWNAWNEQGQSAVFFSPKREGQQKCYSATRLLIPPNHAEKDKVQLID
jgi:hypothetical protein